MLRHERLSGVLELVARGGSVSVDDVADGFGVSAATARRDLDDLAAQQLVTRTRGGAVAHTVNYDLPLRYKSSRQTDEKRRIATAAARLVESGSVIALNGGTTNTEVAREIATTSDVGSLTVVTNALNIAQELAVRPSMKLVVVGGVLRPQSFELIGPFASSVLEGISIDTAFVGADAVSVEDGVAAVHEGEAAVNATMVARSRRVVVVADSSKLGQRAFSTVCGLDRVDALVTDSDADPELVAAFEAAGVDVTLA